MSGLPDADEVEVGAEEYEGGQSAWSTHGEISTEAAMRTQQSRDRIRNIVADEFISEAVETATMLKHLLGSADGVVAEACTTIEQNLVVLALSVREDPVGFLLGYARAIESDQERASWVMDIVEHLVKYVEQI